MLAHIEDKMNGIAFFCIVSYFGEIPNSIFVLQTHKHVV